MDQSTYDKIHYVKDGKSVVLDFRSERSGVCVEACQHDVIKLTVPWESKSTGKRTIMVLHEG
jgi:NAD-dependent dihydropyrimidine dehydrogenase PreA subunit